MPIKFSDIFGTGQDAFSNEKLEEVLNKTRDVAETVGRKSAQRLEISRKMVELLDFKAKLSKLYERYGKLQYSIRIGDEVGGEVLTDIENQIGLLREKIEVYTKDLDEAKAAVNESMAQAEKRMRDVFSFDFKENETDGGGDAVDDDVVEADGVVEAPADKDKE